MNFKKSLDFKRNKKKNYCFFKKILNFETKTFTFWKRKIENNWICIQTPDSSRLSFFFNHKCFFFLENIFLLGPWNPCVLVSFSLGSFQSSYCCTFVAASVHILVFILTRLFTFLCFPSLLYKYMDIFPSLAM